MPHSRPLPTALASRSGGFAEHAEFAGLDFVDADELRLRLVASEARFRSLTRLSSNWYWAQDAEFRFVDTVCRSNDRGGLTPQQHLGLCRWELPNTEPIGFSWLDHRATLDARQSFHDLLLRRTTANGTSHYVEVSGAPMHGIDGSFAGYHGLARDVTQRIEADAALRDAKREADSASAAKSRFLANMSHEIRTPMNGLLGMAGLLLDEPLSVQQKERVQLLVDSGRTLLVIINDILDFSKIEAGELRIERLAFDLHDAVEQLTRMYAVQAQAKSLPLTIDFRAPAPTVLLGDPARLKQVLGNLLANAVKFTERGNVTLRVLLRPAEPDRNAGAEPPHTMLRVEVEDTGVGISPSVSEHLFQPFSQADASTTRRFGGTGLGLVISKHLVELMGGRIGLQSRLGQGSLFWVEIPFGSGERRACVGRADEVAAADWSGLRALLVEDNAINMIVAQTQLERLGVQVFPAIDGALALEALTKQVFDIVLMDCQMPNMDGYEAVQRWRRIEAERDHRRRTPVIALTANAMAGDRERCLEAGYDDHLGKPFSQTDLQRLMAHWLEQQTA
ncbi:MAG: ATP-binding protein [Pseudomonadota bacterium]|nr:ATP-binding protein [Pseudomonadota bacterium]